MEHAGKTVDIINTHKMGMASLIGSAIMATKAHTCSATLGAFLTRKKFRFGYSHDFQWTNIHDFHKNIPNDAAFLHNDGNYFVERRCSAYLQRGDPLEDICLYDFLQYYGLSPRGKKDEHDIEWRDCYHGVENLMLLKKRVKKECK